jgi:hypothetical protein
MAIKKNTPPASLDVRQIEMAHEIGANLICEGYDILEIDYCPCTIDLVLEVGRVKTNNRTKGIFRVFWNDKGNYYFGYLPAGDPFFDGYEIQSGRWINPLSMGDIIPTVEADIKSLEVFHNRFK